jgi:hypothetical protein
LSEEVSFFEIDSMAKILKVENQYGRPCFWALCDVRRKKSTRAFRLIPTGERFPDEALEYLGSILTEGFGGSFVCHFFEQLVIKDYTK